MDAKGLFAVGKSYGVLRLDECGETVTVASIKGRTLRLTDGRTEPDCPHSWADGCDCFAPAAQDMGEAEG